MDNTPNTPWVYNNATNTHELYFNDEVVATVRLNNDEWIVVNNITGYSDTYLADEEDLDSVKSYACEFVIEYYDDVIDFYDNEDETYADELEHYTMLKLRFENEIMEV